MCVVLCSSQPIMELNLQNLSCGVSRLFSGSRGYSCRTLIGFPNPDARIHPIPLNPLPCSCFCCVPRSRFPRPCYLPVRITSTRSVLLVHHKLSHETKTGEAKRKGQPSQGWNMHGLASPLHSTHLEWTARLSTGHRIDCFCFFLVSF